MVIGRMERLRYAGLILAALLNLGSSQLNCTSRFGNDIDETCHTSLWGNPAYRELSTLINDAMRYEHEPEFPIHIFLEMYKYAYTCATYAEAAFHVFVEDHSDDAPDNQPQPTHEWVSQMNPMFNNRSHGHFSSGDITMLHTMIQQLVNDTKPGCLRSIYESRGANARNTFFRLYPDFEPPTAAPPTTSPEAPTTTLANGPTTSTTAPGTAATTATTSPTTPPTSPTAPAPTSTSATGTTSKLPVACTVCESLECLLHVHLRECDRPEHEFCYIRVHDTSNTRNVTRGCADSQMCSDHMHNPRACSDLDSGLLAHDTVCTFCCRGRDCNQPPALLPAVPLMP